jgi:hypothetical protein
MAISNSVAFWLFIFFIIPSILCSIFVLYHLLFDRTLRRALNNHVIILILFFGLLYELTSIIWYIYFYRNGVSWSSTRAFCLIWLFIDDSGYVIIALLVTWASIERHILIFHGSLMLRRRRRFFIHYLPLMVVVVYSLVYFTIILFLIPCNLPFDGTEIRCGSDSCISRFWVLTWWQPVAHRIVPSLTILFFNLALVVRRLSQNRRMRQQIQWRNYRKMSTQLLSISSIYIFLQLPPNLLTLMYLCGLPRSVASDYNSSAVYFAKYTVLLVPLVCVVSLPELRAKLKFKIVCWRRPIRAIAPERIEMNHMVINRPVAVTIVGE